LVDLFEFESQAGSVQGMLAPMHFRIFLLLIGYLETTVKYTKSKKLEGNS
jgi:hypothetical protein